MYQCKRSAFVTAVVVCFKTELVGSLFTNEEQEKDGPDDAVDTCATHAGLEVHHDIKDRLSDAKWPRPVTIYKCALKEETKP